MITHKQRSLIGFGALLALAATQACGSDAGAPDNVSTAGASASPQAGSSPVAGVSGHTATSAGAPSTSAGAPAGVMSGSVAGSPGFGSGGASAGSGSSAAGSSSSAAGAGGRSGGTGGRSGGAGGKSGGGAGSGSAGGPGAGGASGGAVTFTQVAGVLSTACAGAMCHGGTTQLNLTNMTGLYTRLTTPIAAPTKNCVGTTLVVPNNTAGSFLVQVVTAKSPCMNGAASQMVGPMPEGCAGTPSKCLTAAQIKQISDWVAAGAPQ